MGASNKLISSQRKLFSHSYALPPWTLWGSVGRRYHHPPPYRRRGLAQGHTAGKNRPRISCHSSPYSLLFPPAHFVPGVCSESGIRKALNNCPFISLSTASCSGLGDQVTGEKAEATGRRPHSGTGGYSSARMTQTVSLYQLQPLAVCPHLERVHQANLCT